MKSPVRSGFGGILTAFAIIAAVQIAAVQDALARGPVSVADLAERLSPAVVNISTTQTVRQSIPLPQLPDGSPLQEFFEDFFKRQQENNDNNKNQRRKAKFAWIRLCHRPFRPDCHQSACHRGRG